MKNSISISTTWRWRLFNWLLVPSGSRLWESSWSWWVKMPLFMAYMKKWGYRFLGYVQSGKSGSRSLSPHGTSWGRTTSSPTSLVVWTRYIRPGGGPFFLRCSTPFAGSTDILLSISLPQEQMWNCPCTYLPFQIPWLGRKTPSVQLGWSQHLCLPSIHSSRHILLKVLISWNLSMSLVDPL